jgi:hypothetical protein
MRLILAGIVAAWALSLAYWVWRSAYPKPVEPIPEPAYDWDRGFADLVRLYEAGL